MSRIMVVDDMAIFREPIAASLRLAGYQTVSAADGADALGKLSAQRPDLILLDVAMPVMDGLAFLRAVRQDPQAAHIPVIMLTAVSDRDCVVQAGRLGAREYLLKSRFTTKDLLARVRKYLPPGSDGPGGPSGIRAAPAAAPAPPAPPAPQPAASPVQPAPEVDRSTPPQRPPDPASPAPAPEPISPLLDREGLLRRVRTALEARTLSGVVAQVVALATSPRGDLSQLATLIARDPMLTARVLQAANSAAYASGRRVVATLPDAVRHIGCATVRNIAAAFGIFEAMPRTAGDGFDPIRCWQHSFAMAQLCERLAQSADPEAASLTSLSSLAYLVGLCHDLGEILLRTQFAREYRQLTEVQARTGRGRDELERLVLGMSHRELVATVLGCLGLPETIRAPIEAFHAADALAGLPREAALLAQILRLAEHYANGLLLASGADAPVVPLTRAECRQATGRDDPPCPDGEQLRAEILGLTAALARLGRREEADLTVPLFPRRPVRLWLARDPALSAFDPVHAALSALADVDARDRLPEPGETSDHRGLVAVCRRPTSVGFTPHDFARALAAFPPGAPVLWLVQSTDAAPVLRGDSVPAPLAWPVTLGEIHDFVQRV